MPALKLFISHSSRLDDVEHKYTSADHNWRLLQDTCKAIGETYGDRVEVLVDKVGLIPGDDWNRRLNLWLAECHAAIILFSKRAIGKSDWVAKEAAILSWRAELDKDFKLIPVLLDGESTPEDLAKDFFGILNIGKYQCIPNAQTAAEISAGVVRCLGKPEDLAENQTPLGRLQGGIAKLLGEGPTHASLQAALQAVGCSITPDGTPNHERFANRLARRFLSADPEDAAACFITFQCGIDPLSPSLARERARELLKFVRPLWVEPEAAANIPLALWHNEPLALEGQFITQPDVELDAKTGYTLERYLERAWPGSSLYCFVTVPGAKASDEIRAEIRRSYLGSGLPTTIDGAKQDQIINRDPKTIILVIVACSDSGGLPDPRLMQDLAELRTHYDKLVTIFALEAGAGLSRELPSGIREVLPRLESRRETVAYLAERAAKSFLDQKYGIAP
ncbi:MAG: toll/interleukin-1 receptor domain-containing protein [Gammaproteobacteria bacterium]